MAESGSPPPSPSKRKRRPWWAWVLIVLLALAVAGWFFGRDAVHAGRGGMARYYAGSAAAHMEKEEWAEALLDMNLARRWNPDEPAVLRVLADFMIEVKGDAFSLHHLLLRLADAGQATSADYLRIAEFQLTQGDIPRARATLQTLPETDRRQRRAQELLANILRVEGRTAESEDVMRRALMSDSADSGARLRLAMMDFQTPFPEVRAQARDRLWEIAAGGDEAALQAMQYLSGESALTLAQADQLLALVEKHPKPTATVRYKVLSGVLRLRPDSRAAILKTETAKYDPESASGGALLQWLIDEGEYDLLLSLLPAEVGKSQTLLEFRLKALSGAGRWRDVEKLLAESRDLPLPVEVASLWQARASYHLKQDPGHTQQYLMAVYNAAGQGERGEITLEAARFAEECGLWRTAAICYQGIARAHPTAQIRMLEKVHEMALRERDSEAVLKSARYLAEQNPANQTFADRRAYYQLIVGEDMEVAISRGRKGGAPTRAAEWLLRALAAYRMGDLPAVKEHLAGIADTTSLSAGERAVYAGLLAISGKSGPAFQLAEKIPSGLLLPEEMLFLKRAL